MWNKAKPVLKYMYALGVTLMMAYMAWFFYDFNSALWFRLFELGSIQIFALVVGNLGILAAIAATGIALKNLDNKFLEWKLFKSNINFVPLDHLSLRFFFAPLMLFNFPLLAFIEEFIFRDGLGHWPTVTAWDVIWRSVVFGLIHCLGGVKIRSGLVLILAGFYLSIVYIMGGLEMATIFHFHYNTLAILFIFIQWAKTKKNPFHD